jgi:hypothetical protein
VIVLALLASPLSLLARASFGVGNDCNNLCCLPHGSHITHSHAAAAKAAETGMACHHGDTGYATECTMEAGHLGMAYGLLAPIAPTTPSAFVRIALPTPSRSTLGQSTEAPPAGFAAAPFEPPRS